MKKILSAALALFALASCSKADHPEDPVVQGIEMAVDFSTANTRGFFDEEGEDWEKEVKFLHVYVFANGKHIMRKTFTEAELAARNAKFTLPAEADGQTCNFYAVANDTPNIHTRTTESEIPALGSQSIYAFSGQWNPGAYSPTDEGIMMTDKQTLRVASETMNRVSFNLERAFARIALKIDVDPDFSAKYYGGAIKVATSIIYRFARYSCLFDHDGYVPIETDIAFAGQSPAVIDGCFYNVFYSGSIPYREGMVKPYINVRAVFDQDANFNTTDDQYQYEYDIDIEGSGGGEIRRNAYYRIHGTITGLENLDNQAFFMVRQWEVPVINEVGGIRF